jgi:hypothetical protein
MRSVKLVWLLAVVAIGCSSSEALGPGSINGRWAEDFSIPGSSMGMNLMVNGSMISGSGEWCGEAGPCGAVGVVGTINGTAVQLDLSFTQTIPQPGPARIQHFDGRLTSRNALRGSITAPGQPVGQISFHRA